MDLVPFRAGALVVLRALLFTALRAGALVDLRAGARVVLRVAFRVAFRAVLRAGALVAFLVRAFAVLRAGALVVLRAAFVVFLAVVRPVARDFLASDFDVFDADLLAFLARPPPLRAAVARVAVTRRLADFLALPAVFATRFSAAVAAFLIAAMPSPIASWRPSPS